MPAKKPQVRQTVPAAALRCKTDKRKCTGRSRALAKKVDSKAVKEFARNKPRLKRSRKRRTRNRRRGK
jgi:hypothetical protein